MKSSGSPDFSTMAESGNRDAATPVVSAFYDRFPFPGDPLQDGPPPGYNWRWCHQSVLAAVHGSLPAGSERFPVLPHAVARSACRGAPGSPASAERLVTSRADDVEDELPTAVLAHEVE